MIIKVALSHESTGIFWMSEPDGWLDATLGGERDDDQNGSHSIVEYFKSTFRAYGSNGDVDGMRDAMLSIEDEFGPDTKIGQHVYLADAEGDPFTEFFVGEIPIYTFSESVDEEHMLTFIPTIGNVWQKLMTRMDMPVDLQSPTSVDGIAVDVIAPIVMPMPSQAILKSYQSALEDSYILSDGWVGTGIPPFGRTITTQFANRWLQVGFDPSIDEIEQVTNYLSLFNEAVPVGYLEPVLPGTYRIRCQIICAIINGFGLTDVGSGDYIYSYFMSDFDGRDVINFFYQKNNEAPVQFPIIQPDVSIGSGEFVTRFALDVTLDLIENDSVKIFGKFDGEVTKSSLSVDDGIGFVLYGRQTSGVDGSSLHGTTEDDHIFNIRTPDLDIPYSYLTIEAKTLYQETTADVFFTFDTIRSIIDRITDQNDTLRSNYFGSPVTSKVYEEYGCGSETVQARGLQVRGYPVSEKRFFGNWKDAWQSLNAHFNLSYWYEMEGDKMVIRIEEKREAYDFNSYSIRIPNIRKITRRYDMDHAYNTYRIGNQQWQSEDISGLDDPQTVHVYGNRFKNVQNEFEQLSPWITASLAIETTRRTRKEQSADYKFDENIFLIRVIITEEPFSVTPELMTVVSSVTNLKYPETRYNLRLTPARQMLRWLPYINGQLQPYPDSVFKFLSGEGNYIMTSVSNSVCPGNATGEEIAEDQDIPVSNDFLFLPEAYDIEAAISLQDYKSFISQKNKSIEISQTTSAYTRAAVKSFDFNPTQQKNFRATVWTKKRLKIRIIDTDETEHEGVGCIFDSSFDYTFCR